MYIIDDSNSTIQYSNSATGIPWDHKVPGIANNTADPTQCYEQTYTVNQNMCAQSDMCHFQILFTGSGISIFVIQSSDPLNATISIDGKASTIATMAALPGPGSPHAYNVTLYNVQSLATADHMLNVALTDYIYSDGTTKPSMMRFDAAAVNETSPIVVSPSPSTSGADAATPTPTPNVPAPSQSADISRSLLPTGPIVGGAVGGFAVLVAVILALLFYRRRKPSQNAAVFNPQPRHPGLETRTTPFNPTLYGSHLPSSVEYVQPLSYATPSTFSVPTSDYSNDQRTNSYHPSVSSGRTHSSLSGLLPWGNTFRTSNDPSADMQLFAVTNPVSRVPSYTAGSFIMGSSRHPELQPTGSSSAPFITTSPQPTTASSRELTEEQLIYLNNLHNSNVSPADIAQLMEVMRRQEGTSLGGGSSQVNPILEEGTPPIYDFKSPN